MMLVQIGNQRKYWMAKWEEGEVDRKSEKTIAVGNGGTLRKRNLRNWKRLAGRRCDWRLPVVEAEAVVLWKNNLELS